jgi:antirestriction protein
MELSVAVDAMAEVVGTDKVAQIIQTKAEQSKADFIERARQHLESEVEQGNATVVSTVVASESCVVFVEERLGDISNLGFINTADLSAEAKAALDGRAVGDSFEFNGVALTVRAAYRLNS